VRKLDGWPTAVLGNFSRLRRDELRNKWSRVEPFTEKQIARSGRAMAKHFTVVSPYALLIPTQKRAGCAPTVVLPD